MGGKNEPSLQAHQHFIRSEIEAANFKVKQKLWKTALFNQTCIELPKKSWYDIPSVEGGGWQDDCYTVERDKTLQPVKQGEAIKPIPDELMIVLSILGIGNSSSLQSFGFVRFLRTMIATSVICIQIVGFI